MKMILIGGAVVVAVLVSVVAAVLVAGMLLPEKHVATVRAEFAAPPSEVFRVIADFPNHPRWRSDVKRMEQGESTSEGPVWLAIGTNGALPLEVTESVPPERLVTTIRSDGLPFGGRWVYRIDGTANGSVVTITEQGEVYNPLFRFVGRFIIGHHATATRFLTDLGRHLGDSAEVERLD